MPRRNLIPIALLAVLTIGALVFAVIGFAGAPSATTINVQNATETTFGSPTGSTSFLMDLVSTLSSGSQSGTLSQEHVVDFVAPDLIKVAPVGTRSKTVVVLHQPAVSCALNAYTAMLQGPTAWTQKKDTYTRIETVAAYSARVPRQVGTSCEPQPVSASGQVYESAVIRSGYLVAARVRIVVPAQTLSNGRTAAHGVETQTMIFIEIGGVLVRTIKS
jgi:hypothetical protein